MAFMSYRNVTMHQELRYERIDSMKPLRWFSLIFILLFLGNPTSAMDIGIQTGLVSNWWDSDTNDRGNQTYVPVTIDATQGDFGARVLTAMVTTHIDPSDNTRNSMTTVVDTKLNLSYALVDKWPVDLLFGLDFNLPTGLTNLDRKIAACFSTPTW